MQPSQVVAHIDWHLALKPRQQSLHFFSAVLRPRSSVLNQRQPALASGPDARASLDPEVPPSRASW